LKSLIIHNKLKLSKLSKKKHVSYFVIKFNYFLTTKNNLNNKSSLNKKKFDLNLKNPIFLIFFLNHDFFPAVK